VLLLFWDVDARIGFTGALITWYYLLPTKKVLPSAGFGTWAVEIGFMSWIVGLNVTKVVLLCIKPLEVEGTDVTLPLDTIILLILGRIVEADPLDKELEKDS